jgi:hypothetical protein
MIPPHLDSIPMGIDFIAECRPLWSMETMQLALAWDL